MSEERSDFWRRKIEALHNRSREHRRARRYDLAQLAQVELRDAYEAWALEINFDG